MLFFYFSFSFFLDYINKISSPKRNITFTNNIRVSFNEIPYRNNQIIEKFNIAKFNFKLKPYIVKNFTTDYTDSEIGYIDIHKTTVADLSLSENVDNTFLKNRFILENKEENLPGKEFIKVANNLGGMNNNTLSSNINILETIDKAIKYNPKIKAQKSSYESSKENIKQVYSAIFPSIEINLSKGYKDENSSSSTTKTNENRSPEDFSINLEQNLYTGGKFTAEAKKAKSQLFIEKENLRLTEYEIILDSALAYLNVLEKKKLIELNNLKEEKFKNDFESIDLLVKVGNASQSDLVFAQSMLVQISAEKIASINDFTIAKANYKKIVGETLPNGELKKPEINKINFPENFDNALNIALKNNPIIKIAELEENIAKFDVKSQFAEALPNISLDAEYQSTNNLTSKGSSSDSAEITAKINVPIFKGGKNISKIKEAKIIAKKVRFELENKKNEVVQTVTKSWSDFQTSETFLKSANINIEARKLILEGVEQEAKLGIKSYVDLLQSKEELIDAEFNKITATKNYIFNALRLKADIGELSVKDLYI